MAEQHETETRRRRPDLLTLFAGVATLFASAYVLTNGEVWVPTMDPRWLLAGGALLVGVLMLASSLRRRDR